jgi:hypothetical protein
MFSGIPAMEHYARTRVGEGICNANCDQRLVLANEERATGQAGATIVVSLGAAKANCQRQRRLLERPAVDQSSTRKA